MLYHYTSFDALRSIIQEIDSKVKMCFWATRYDCFEDKEELKLGVETIMRLLPNIEKDLNPDRRIASYFDWNVIKGNGSLPFPYVVSFTSRPDNDFMWKEYAKSDGVVLAIDDCQYRYVKDSPMVRLVSCVYVDEKDDDELIDMLGKEYANIGYGFLLGSNGVLGFELLKNCPREFVMLIAVGLLSFFAPRIKNAREYKVEEETRAILPMPIPEYNKFIEKNYDMIAKSGLLPDGLSKMISAEYSRKRSNGSILHYRKLFMPMHLLKCVYVRTSNMKDNVESFLKERGLHIPVMRITE